MLPSAFFFSNGTSEGPTGVTQASFGASLDQTHFPFSSFQVVIMGTSTSAFVFCCAETLKLQRRFTSSLTAAFSKPLSYLMSVILNSFSGVEVVVLRVGSHIIKGVVKFGIHQSLKEPRHSRAQRVVDLGRRLWIGRLGESRKRQEQQGRSKNHGNSFSLSQLLCRRGGWRNVSRMSY